MATPVDFEKDKVDFAIQFGDGKWSGVETALLFRDLLQPICSPALQQKAGITKIDDLAKVKLLYSHCRRTDWTIGSRRSGAANFCMIGDQQA